MNTSWYHIIGSLAPPTASAPADGLASLRFSRDPAEAPRPGLILLGATLIRGFEIHLRLAAAAKALSYTPSAVSQQMTALSRDIGVLLFERTPRGMRLTDSAHALIAHCDTSSCSCW
jgi:hypothetical protein